MCSTDGNKAKVDSVYIKEWVGENFRRDYKGKDI